MSNPPDQLAGSQRQGFLSKFKGEGMALPAAPSLKSVALAWLGGALTISIVSALTTGLSTPLVLGSFGASCVLLFGYPDVPFSQPRNTVLGHFLSSLIGVVFLSIFGPSWWAAGLATGTAIGLMMLTRTVHPPAGSNPVIVFLAHPGWSFIFYPTLIGALIVTTTALVYNNSTRTSNYPKYW